MLLRRERRTVQALVVGAGFAGLGMAIRLEQAGIHEFLVFERHDSVGGTWWENTYPGCACDVPSHLYSFSFEPNPSWTLPYAPQKEILEYLRGCVDKYGLVDRIRFRSNVVRAEFDEEQGLWEVETEDGALFAAPVLVLGTGPLNRPIYPDIPGLDSFRGPSFHSARWDHSVPLAGKTVAVVGTGASAIQIVPAIAPEVGRLQVFQRNPPWILPKRNGEINEQARARFARSPALQHALRAGIYGITELFGLGFTYAPRVMDVFAAASRRYLEKSIPDPSLRAKLTPGYRMGCKRVLFSNDYYPALLRDNVELVTDRIVEVRERSIVTEHDGTRRERPIDVLVLATGFEAAEMTAPFPIRGRGGRTIDESWTSGPEGYRGTTFAGFPNLFMIIGPNTGLGHTSMVVMMEAQIGYILGALRAMKKRNLKFVDVRPEAQRRYNQRLQARLARSVWNTGGAKSWYLTRGGKNTTLWPGLTMEYRLRMKRFDVEAYECVPAGAAARAPRENGARWAAA